VESICFDQYVLALVISNSVIPVQWVDYKEIVVQLSGWLPNWRSVITLLSWIYCSRFRTEDGPWCWQFCWGVRSGGLQLLQVSSREDSHRIASIQGSWLNALIMKATKLVSKAFHFSYMIKSGPRLSPFCNALGLVVRLFRRWRVDVSLSELHMLMWSQLLIQTASWGFVDPCHLEYNRYEWKCRIEDPWVSIAVIMCDGILSCYETWGERWRYLYNTSSTHASKQDHVENLNWWISKESEILMQASSSGKHLFWPICPSACDLQFSYSSAMSGDWTLL